MPDQSSETFGCTTMRPRPAVRQWSLALLVVAVAFAATAQAAIAQSPTETPAPQDEAGQPVAPDQPREHAGLFQQQVDEAALDALVGSWEGMLGDERIALRLRRDMSFVLGPTAGRFSIEGGKLHLVTDERTRTYDFLVADNTLQLTGGELGQPLELTRRLDMQRMLANVANISPRELGLKVYRVLLILGIVLIARLVIFGLQGLSHALVFWEWGPLSMVYRHDKNRARTIHSLILNLTKYFIYFTALGMILSELGVNYATYLASLSVIGLAIGFGSQGLVQDMVTGFFLIFEGQFDVGDMVEVSGQTGYVDEMGLRMTRIRNYLGQVVVIPNRNIGAVANYSRDGQRAYLDVPIAGPAAAEKARATLLTMGRELARQYPGVVIEPITTSGALSLETGEHFVRLHLSIWPGQTWLIDQQLLPRTRDLFARESIEIPGDRLSVYYHARPKSEQGRWRNRLPWPRRHAADAAADARTQSPTQS